MSRIGYGEAQRSANPVEGIKAGEAEKSANPSNKDINPSEGVNQPTKAKKEKPRKSLNIKEGQQNQKSKEKPGNL